MEDIEKFKNIQKEGLNLFEKKNKDYGDSYKEFGGIGILVRMNDKINRCLNITKNNVSMINDENLRDTLIDLHNYSTMAIMELDNSNSNKPIVSSSNHYSNSL